MLAVLYLDRLAEPFDGVSSVQGGEHSTRNIRGGIFGCGPGITERSVCTSLRTLAHPGRYRAGGTVAGEECVSISSNS